MHSIIADLALLLVALIWGLTFPAIKDALTGVSPFIFLTIRFSIACLFLLILYPRSLKKLNKTTLKAGFLIGMALLAGYSFQTVGIQYTSASNAAFITGLTVVIVPLINIPFSGKLPNKYSLLGGLIAAVGLSLLTLGDNFKVNYGDILLLFCAVSFATHILLVSKYAPIMDSNLITIIQIGTVALISGLFALKLETLPEKFSTEFWVALAICAIPATSLAYWIQNKVQKYTSPAHTAIVFTMEPVFGAIFAYFWMGETLSTRGIIGCIFVLAGMLMAELKGR